VGDYADETRATRASAPKADPQRKPSPKGSDGTKPTARRRGDKPKPKRSGALIEAHQAARGLATGRIDHPAPVAVAATTPIDRVRYETGIAAVDSAGPGQCEATRGGEHRC
jgi:hypothetical protein